jgi:lysophospholipase
MESFTDDRRARPEALIFSQWRARDGWPLRAFDMRAFDMRSARDRPRGSILFQTGRADFIEKYIETIAGWHDAGWSVSGFDWRGQGGSGRFLDDATIGHADSLDLLLDDLDAYVADWRARTPAPHVVIGHSMGGHLVLRWLANGGLADAAVLVAPMLGLNSGRLPDGITAAVTEAACRIGLARRPAWRDGDRPGGPRAQNLTHSAERFADELWWKAAAPELVVGPPTWGWLRAAFRSIHALMGGDALERIATPLLILGAAHDRLVDIAAIRAAAMRIPRATLIESADGAHELLRETDALRDPMLAAIAAFLDAHAPRG